MKRTGGGMIIGVFFLLVGVSILLRVFFNLDIPLVKTAFGFFIIYLGIKIVFGSFGVKSCPWTGDSGAFFSHRLYRATDTDRKYNVAFGSSKIDLTDAKDSKNGPVEIK